MDIIVTDWRYDDGWITTPLLTEDTYDLMTTDKRFDPESKGWRCWVYAKTEIEFDDWMKQHMKGKYNCVFVYSPNYQAYVIYIQDEQDAAYFKLAWLCDN